MSLGAPTPMSRLNVLGLPPAGGYGASDFGSNAIASTE